MADSRRWWRAWDGLRCYYCVSGQAGVDDTEVQVVPLDAVVAEKGSWLWAVSRLRAGARLWNDCLGKIGEGEHKGVTHAGYHTVFCDGVSFDTGWYELPPAPPPWQPKRGDRVRWYRGEDSGTGTYENNHNGVEGCPYIVRIGGAPLGVEKIEPLAGEEAQPTPEPTAEEKIALAEEFMRGLAEPVTPHGEEDKTDDRYVRAKDALWRYAGRTIRRYRRRWQWERRRADETKWERDHARRQGEIVRRDENKALEVGVDLSMRWRDACEARDAAQAEVARLTHELADMAEQDKAALKGMRRERDEARAAMVNAAVPLETLAHGRAIGVSEPLQREIEAAVLGIRDALGPRAAPPIGADAKPGEDLENVGGTMQPTPRSEK